MRPHKNSCRPGQLNNLQFSMLEPLGASVFRVPGVRIGVAAFLLVVGFFYFSYPVEITIATEVVQQEPSVPSYIPNRDVPKEKYITLLAPGSPHSWDEGHYDPYFETVTIMAHRLLHHEFTKDRQGREFIVLATDHVKEKQIKILQDLGATVQIVNPLPPPSNVNPDEVYGRWKDQYTKLLLWNMTQYERLVYIDADALVIKPIEELFDLPTVQTGDEEWLFASVYDAAPVKGFGSYPDGIPTLGPDDKYGHDLFSGGQFVLMPTQKHADYVFSIYHNPPDVDFKSTMEQSFLRYCYRDDGPYPWVRLSQIYNTQWPRAQDIAASKVIHEKSWDGGPNGVNELKEEWHKGWGDVQGYLALKQGLNEYAKEGHPITKN